MEKIRVGMGPVATHVRIWFFELANKYDEAAQLVREAEEQAAINTEHRVKAHNALAGQIESGGVTKKRASMAACDVTKDLWPGMVPDSFESATKCAKSASGSPDAKPYTHSNPRASLIMAQMKDELRTKKIQNPNTDIKILAKQVNAAPTRAPPPLIPPPVPP